MNVTDELLQNAERYAEGFDKGALPMPPGSRLRLWRAWTLGSTCTGCWVSARATPM